MPIRPVNAHLYKGADYEYFRDLVRGRAANKCQACSVPNGENVFFTWSDSDPDFHRALWWDGHYWITQQGVRVPFEVLESKSSVLRLGPDLKYCRVLKVKCGISHTDHDPRHRDPDRARWLCDRCHLAHDLKDNYARSRRLKAARHGQGWLLGEIQAAAMPEGMGGGDE